MRPLGYYDELEGSLWLLRAETKQRLARQRAETEQHRTPAHHAVEPERDYKINGLRPSETWYHTAQLNPQPENTHNPRMPQAKQSGPPAGIGSRLASAWCAAKQFGAPSPAPHRPEWYSLVPKKKPEYVY